MKKTMSILFSVYILSFPFKLVPMFQAFKRSLARAASVENGLFLMLIGLVLILISTRGTLYFRSELLRRSIGLCVALVGISLLTSLILLPSFGTLHGENTLSGSFSQDIYYLLIAVVFFFNANVFENVTKKQLRKLLDGLVIFFLALGVVQMMILFHIPGVRVIYDGLDVMDLFVDAVSMLRMNRICLTSSEPAGIGITVGVLLMPYVLSMVMTQKNNTKYVLFAIGLTVLCFFALSSTVVVALLLNFIVFSVFTIKKVGADIAAVGILSALLIVVILTSTGVLEGTYVGEKINFLLVEKTTSTDNLSSGYRYSTVVNDLICFLKYPITGVGNGNQGFLYNASMSSPYVTDAMRENYQTVHAIEGEYGLVAGGPFVPAFLSGYGCAGLLMAASYVSYMLSQVRAKKKEMGNFFFMFGIGAVTFLLEATVAAGIEGNFTVMFVLSLPLMAVHTMDSEEGKPHGAINPPRGNIRHHPHYESAGGSA